MSIKLTSYDESIERHLEDGRPIFRGAVPPETHSYILRLSSVGYTPEEILSIIKKRSKGIL